MADLKIAIDCMGGDYGPSVVIPAVHQSLLKQQSKGNKNICFKLFGDEALIHKELNKNKLSSHPNITVIPSKNDVLMSDKPALALKVKKESSMRLALESVRDGRANACVSAGNTGALMAVSRFILRMIPGIDRPAIISAIPTLSDTPVYLLDLGANIDCDEKRLCQFAVMGNELCKSVDLVKEPVIGLLNVGEEENKGTDRLKLTAKMLSENKNLNYQGFIEANQIFDGHFNVVVTDGFTGNSVLKASEGLSLFLTTKLKLAFQKNWITKLIGLLAKPVISVFKNEIDPDRYNGASLIGLRGIVIKSHGSANVNATVNAIEEAIEQARSYLPSKIRQSLEATQL